MPWLLPRCERFLLAFRVLDFSESKKKKIHHSPKGRVLKVNEIITNSIDRFFYAIYTIYTEMQSKNERKSILSKMLILIILLYRLTRGDICDTIIVVKVCLHHIITIMQIQRDVGEGIPCSCQISAGIRKFAEKFKNKWKLRKVNHCDDRKQKNDSVQSSGYFGGGNQ